MLYFIKEIISVIIMISVKINIVCHEIINICYNIWTQIENFGQDSIRINIVQHRMQKKQMCTKVKNICLQGQAQISACFAAVKLNDQGTKQSSFYMRSFKFYLLTSLCVNNIS